MTFITNQQGEGKMSSKKRTTELTALANDKEVFE